MQGSTIASGLALAGVVSLSIAFALGPQRKTPPRKAPAPTYAKLAPLFKQKCATCHMGARPKHGLDLTSYANVMKGDKEGKVVIPGKAGQSRLSLAVHHAKGAAAMPPTSTLPAIDVAMIDTWINLGAKEK
ncbi:MAG: c-type cytochrome domain-containing protein [Fimbriimonadales bacterium]